MNGVNMSGFRDLYPWDGDFLDRSGMKLHYLDEGEETPWYLSTGIQLGHSTGGTSFGTYRTRTV